MVNKFQIDDCKFLMIKSRADNYNFFGVCNDGKKEVFVPTLNKVFSYKEVEFTAIFTSDYLKRIPGLKDKVNYDTNDVGNVFSYYNEKLSISDVKKIEKHRNSDIKKTTKR